MQNDSSVHTSCDKCCFQEKIKHNQIDCKLGRIVQFQKQGAEVTQEQGEHGLYFRINRVCNAQRLGEPLETFEEFKVAAAKVSDQIRIKCDFVVPIHTKHSLLDFTRSLDMIHTLSLKPKTTFFVNNSNIPTSQLINEIALHSYHQTEMWQVIDIVQFDKGKLTSGECVDLAAPKIKSDYLAVFEAGEIIPSNYLQNINYRINEELERFSILVSNNPPNGTFLTTSLYKHPIILGNQKVTYRRNSDGKEVFIADIELKLAFLADEDNKPHMIGTVKCE